MNRTFAMALSAIVGISTGAILSTASAQDRSAQPGQPTQGKVWIQNQGGAEAIPVSIQQVTSPVAVQVKEIPEVTLARQRWEYSKVVIPSGEDAVPALNRADANGWEATNIVIATDKETVVIVKRRR